MIKFHVWSPVNVKSGGLPPAAAAPDTVLLDFLNMISAVCEPRLGVRKEGARGEGGADVVCLRY